jgi:hypothetical protein
MERNMNEALMQMANGEKVTHDLTKLFTDED